MTHAALSMRRTWLLAALLLLIPALALASDPASDPADDQGHGDDESTALIGEVEGEHGDEAHGDETHGEEAHGEAGHGDAEHGGGHGAGHEHLELPHLFMVLRQFVFPHNETLVHYSHVFENAFFAILAGLVLSLIARRLYRHRSAIPGRLQAFAEMFYEQALDITTTMLGEKDGRKYAPFVATIFVYLLFMNYSVLIPLGKSPTATLINNLSIAACVFLYVQYTGIRRNGIGGYVHHLMGSPKDAVGWAISPLMLFLEIIGELIKPLSLSLRLFGNIFGEDTLLAVFALLGVVAMSFIGSPVGLPLHVPFLFLSLLLGMIQALVFALLSTVYISLMLPHDDHEHETAEAH